MNGGTSSLDGGTNSPYSTMNGGTSSLHGGTISPYSTRKSRVASIGVSSESLDSSLSLGDSSPPSPMLAPDGGVTNSCFVVASESSEGKLTAGVDTGVNDAASMGQSTWVAGAVMASKTVGVADSTVSTFMPTSPGTSGAPATGVRGAANHFSNCDTTSVPA